MFGQFFQAKVKFAQHFLKDLEQNSQDGRIFILLF